MIFRPDMKTCGYKEDVCKTYPNLKDCKVDEDGNGGSNTSAYNSGFSHGCSDAKISDSSKRYINQPGKGSNYHTPEFMRGYNDGFDSCSGDNDSSSISNMQKEHLESLFKLQISLHRIYRRHYCNCRS